MIKIKSATQIEQMKKAGALSKMAPATLSHGAPRRFDF